MLDYVEVTGRYELVSEFYGEVGEESRYMRFLAAVSDVQRMYKYIWEMCGGRTMAAYLGRELVGLIDISPCGDMSIVEVGIVVKDRLQGRGLGGAIAKDMLEVLAKLGVEVATAQIVRENSRALAIARRAGASVVCKNTLCVVELDLSRWRRGGPRGATIGPDEGPA